VYGMTTMKDTKGLSAFDRSVEDARNCIRANAVAGNSALAVKGKCMTGEGIALPLNKTEANKIIAETASVHLTPGDDGLSSQLPTTEAAISSKLSNCSTSSDFEACKTTQLASSDATNIPKMKDTIVTNIELSSARQLTIMEDAAKGKNLIVHFDDESIENLPIQVKSEYGSAAKRQIAFMTSYRYLASESAGLSKEIAKIALKKAEESSRPFFENKAIDDIAKVMR
jgi:hypothetical protein